MTLWKGGLDISYKKWPVNTMKAEIKYMQEYSFIVPELRLHSNGDTGWNVKW